jgi:hypothetical protein
MDEPVAEIVPDSPPAQHTHYIDTSALLRIVLREPGALDELRSYDTLVSSELIAVEIARTLDGLRLQESLTTDEAADRVRLVTEWLDAIDLVLLRHQRRARSGSRFSEPEQPQPPTSVLTTSQSSSRNCPGQAAS